MTISSGYIFTLNQDLFVERWYVPREKLLTIPGIKPLSWNSRERPLARDDYIPVPSTLTETQGSISNHLYYIKLHGSMNWMSSDGQGLLVIGGEKRAQIQREKLLHCYFKRFKDVLSRRNRRLLVIGYGFGDSHINQVIAHAIRKCGLKLYVISPASPRDFRATLLGDRDEDKKTLEDQEALEDKKTLWEGLAGYWDWELKHVCPVTENYFSEEIRRAIFQY